MISGGITVLIKKYNANRQGEPQQLAVLDRAKPGKEVSRPFFIVGAGRSGTTMLRLILAGHSSLHVCPETWFIADLAAHLPLRAPLTPAELELAITLITGHYRWPDMGLTETELRRLVAGLERPTLRATIDAIYGRLAQAVGKPRIGDKTPLYVRILPTLAELYPDAQFIHLLRDGRDVAMSYIDAEWLRHRCYQGDRFEWTAAVRAARDFAAKARAGTWFELRYEDLVAAPQVVVRRLCAYLGEDFEPGMFDFADRVDLVPERERQIHPRLIKPITTEAIGKWQHLSPIELFVMEACLHRDLIENGYALRHAGRMWRPILALAGACLMLASPALQVIVPAMKRRGLIPARAYL